MHQRMKISFHHINVAACRLAHFAHVDSPLNQRKFYTNVSVFNGFAYTVD